MLEKIGRIRLLYIVLGVLLLVGLLPLGFRRNAALGAER